MRLVAFITQASVLDRILAHRRARVVTCPPEMSGDKHMLRVYGRYRIEVLKARDFVDRYFDPTANRASTRRGAGDTHFAAYSPFAQTVPSSRVYGHTDLHAHPTAPKPPDVRLANGAYVGANRPLVPAESGQTLQNSPADTASASLQKYVQLRSTPSSLATLTWEE